MRASFRLVNPAHTDATFKQKVRYLLPTKITSKYLPEQINRCKFKLFSDFSFPFAKPKLNFRVEWSVVVRFSIFGTKEKQFLVCAGETTKSFLNQLILESPVEHRKRVKAPLEGADAFDSKIKLQSDYSLTDWKTFQKSPLSTSHCNFLRSFGSSEN